MAAQAAIAARVGDFYESHPYPPPVDDVGGLPPELGRRGAGARNRHLIWPSRAVSRRPQHSRCRLRHDAGRALRACAGRAPASSASTSAPRASRSREGLKRKHRLDNLELRQLAVEARRRTRRAVRLRRLYRRAPPSGGSRSRDYARCASVRSRRRPERHGLRAVRTRGRLHAAGVLPASAASAGRTRRFAISQRPSRRSRPIIRSRRCCAIRRILRIRPRWPTRCCIRATAHTTSRSSSSCFDRGGFAFARWVRQAPYLPRCGAPASTPHAARACARFRAKRSTQRWSYFAGRWCVTARSRTSGDDASDAERGAFRRRRMAWIRSIAVPGTIAVRERLPAGAAAVLINRNHTDTDLYFPVSARQERLLAAVDAERTIAEICGDVEDADVRTRLFRAIVAMGPGRFRCVVAARGRREGAIRGHAKQAAFAKGCNL